MQTPEQQLEKIKEQNRIRSKRYYDSKKEIIAVRRKESRDECKTCKEEVKNKPVEKPKKDNSKIVLNREESTTQLKESIISESSKRFYENTLKTLEDILDCSDFNKCLKNSKTVIYKIESAHQKKDPSKLYSINTKKGLYQAILKLIDTLGIKISKNAREAYVNKFELTAITSHEQTKNKIANNETMDFKEYIKKVKDKFGETSKEYLVVLLYDLSGFRDNLQLLIIQKESEATKKDINYIVVPPSKTNNLKIVLNEYKTSGKYGQDVITIPKDLSKLIRNYMEINDLTNNDYLFGKAKLSGFIKKFNDKMGLNITINNLRQMRVSSVLNNNPSDEQRLKLSKEMKHKPITSENYKRKTKNIIV